MSASENTELNNDICDNTNTELNNDKIKSIIALRTQILEVIDSILIILNEDGFGWLYQDPISELCESKTIIDNVNLSEILLETHNMDKSIDKLDYLDNLEKNFVDILEYFKEKKQESIKITEFEKLFRSNLPEGVNYREMHEVMSVAAQYE